MQTVSGVFKILPAELRLETTLKCGQSFRWKRVESPCRILFRCTLWDSLVTLEQTDTELKYWRLMSPESPSLDDTMFLLHDYLSLRVDLLGLYKEWSAKDPHFRRVSTYFLGLRMLRQVSRTSLQPLKLQAMSILHLLGPFREPLVFHLFFKQ